MEMLTLDFVLERWDLPCMYLALHQLESVFVVNVITAHRCCVIIKLSKVWQMMAQLSSVLLEM